ncbi:MAG TPA: hypothetical protein VEW74_02785, partial [Candidatus Nitrosotalea sp.]|nr:hypothetical protein [Candidatus Nitrosotalea sp.]
MNRVLLPMLATALIGAAAQSSQKPNGLSSFAAAVAKERVELTFDDGRFAGPGAAVIQNAVAGVQYVMIGEDHGIAEIPAFSTALCRAVAPQGFDTLAVEIGPSTAAVLSDALASTDPYSAVARYDAQHPFSIAFYDFDEEFAFLRACREAMGPEHFALWGLDQELMGSAGALLAATSTAAPSQDRAAVERLEAEDAADSAKAMKSGDAGDMSMVNFNVQELESLRADFAARGIAVPALNELIASERIYREDMSGLRQSNLDRTALQRAHFIAEEHAAFVASGVHPRVLLKMGAYHLFEGTSMIGDRELGNLLVEYAALQGKQAVN